MDHLLGTGILAASYLFFCAAWMAHRGSPRAKWVDWPGASMLVCVALTTMFPIGLGFLIKGLLGPLPNPFQIGLAPFAVTAALLALCFIGGRWFWRMGQAPAMDLPEPVNHNRAPLTVARKSAA